jgi:endoglucanase
MSATHRRWCRETPMPDWSGRISLGALAARWRGSTGVATNERTPVDRHGRLRVRGRYITGRHGEPVILRGMSLFWSQWIPQFHNAAALRWLRDDWKIDVIRAAVGVHPDGYLSHPEWEMEKLEAVIEAGIKLGLYVIVDWHAHEPELDRAAGFFARVAGKYGALPNLIYETWNEPLGEYDWGGVIKPYHQRVASRIRAQGCENLIVAGTPKWCQNVEIAAADPLEVENVAYALHFYAATHGEGLRRKAAIALRCGAPLMVTEWGTCGQDGNGKLDVRQTRRWWKFLEANKIGYVNWALGDKAETSAALLPGADAQGGWHIDMLSPSGRLVRKRLRRMRCLNRA